MIVIVLVFSFMFMISKYSFSIISYIFQLIQIFRTQFLLIMIELSSLKLVSPIFTNILV